MENSNLAANSVSDAFSGVFSVPPTDVIVGMAGIFVFGLVLGALIYLPIAEKNSNLPLEKLSGEIIWRYKPDWLIFMLGCVIFLGVSFMLVSGVLRVL